MNHKHIGHTVLAMGLALGLAACDGNADRQLPGGGMTPPPPPPPPPEGVMVLGVTESNVLVRFSVDDPGMVDEIGQISVNGGENVVGLDFRPASGALFAVTSDGRLLGINPETAAASVITDNIVPDGGLLDGDRFGVDFNPAANALRVVSNAGQNLRIGPAALPPNTGAAGVADRQLGYIQGLVAAAYTNPEGPTARPDAGTMLFVIDIDGVVHTQNANDGMLTEIGPLGIDPALDRVIDYAIAEVPEPILLKSASLKVAPVLTVNEHYVMTERDGVTTLHSINPLTGEATEIDNFPAGDHVGLIVEADEDGVPDQRFIGVMTAAEGSYTVNLFTLNLTDSSLTLDESLEVMGLDGEVVIGLDQRTTQLPDLDVGYAVTASGGIYTLNDNDTSTAIVADLLATLTVPLEGERFGVDFNPRADLLRIVSDNGQNLRVNLEAGRVIADEARVAGLAFVDGRVRLGDPAPQIVATAYRAAPQSLDGVIPALDFQYALDARNSTLARVAVPNDGALVEVGPLGVTLDMNDVEMAAAASLDIAGDDDVAYAAIRSGTQTGSTLYQIDLMTGAAMLLGAIGGNEGITAIAVMPMD
jgi:hypothetical protein